MNTYYYIEKIGSGYIEGTPSTNLLTVADTFDTLVLDRIREGWDVVQKDLRLGVVFSSVVFTRKTPDFDINILGYQIKSKEVE